MRSLLNFLGKYHLFFLFVVLEALSIMLIVRYNSFHRVSFVNSSNAISGRIYEDYNNVVDYFSLRKINESLATENARLRSRLQSILYYQTKEFSNQNINQNLFEVISATVINNSVNKRHNYITLNKGKKQGIKPDMGIVCPEGIVGVVVSVSNNYSTALSVLNSRWAVNVKLSGTGHFGPLRWSGNNPEIAVLNEIPYHVRVDEGQKVVTSGYSAIFPANIPVGVVERVEYHESETFQKIYVRLSTSFANIHYVDVIQNTTKEEQIELENLIQNE
jgi:rod shape-determining protein MreC